jgi:hypothetical protein
MTPIAGTQEEKYNRKREKKRIKRRGPFKGF